jgi:D-alanyl-D-alanine carboxypeptidase
MARTDRVSVVAAALGVALAVGAGIGLGLLGGGPAQTPPVAEPASTGSPTPTDLAPTDPTSTSPAPTSPAGPGSAPVTSSSTSPGPPDNGATPAPSWLGTRLLPTDSTGHAAAAATPPELVVRRIVTVDVLPPPADGRFHSTVSAVTAAIAARSSWEPGCPVPIGELRYLTVSFRGFDGRAHTGELLVHRTVATGIVRTFEQLFAIDFPIERMTVTSRVELDAPPTGDGNNTSGYACRAIRGQTTWSEHAYGRAIDVNPFLNPYLKGEIVLPELATAYADRGRDVPGMILPGGPVVTAFRNAGFRWGGDFRSLKDYQHFSTTGR